MVFFFCKLISIQLKAVALSRTQCEHQNWCQQPSSAAVAPGKTKIDVPQNIHPFRRFLTCILAYVKFSYLLSLSFPSGFIHSDLWSGPVLITPELLLSPQSREHGFARQKPSAVGSTQKVIVQPVRFMGHGLLPSSSFPAYLWAHVIAGHSPSLLPLYYHYYFFECQNEWW